MARRLAEQEEFRQRWPKYCRVCGAAGEQCDSYDPSPSGVSLGSGSIEDCYPCEGNIRPRRGDPGPLLVPLRPCTEEGFCPRCEAPALVSDGEYDRCLCIHCGWYYKVSKSAPPPAECICDYQNMPDDWPPTD